MKAQILGLRVAGTIFLLVSILHLLRLITRASVVIGDLQIPVFTSVGGVLITGALGVWLWRLSQSGSKGSDVNAGN